MKMNNNLQIINELVYQCEPQFNKVSVFGSAYQNAFGREAQFAMQAMENNKYLASVAVSNRQSLINAVINVAAIGISLNPAEKEAYLVPRDGRVCLDISYVGLMRLATDTGQIAWVQADIVYEQDHFRMMGLDKQPEHRYNAFCKDRDLPVGVYVTAKLANGDYLTEIMTTEEINAVRDKSQSYIAFVSGKAKSSIWNDHWGEMAKKTVVKRAHKYWPKSERLERAIYHLNTDASEGVSESAMSVDLVKKWTDEVAKASSEDELRAMWHPAASEFRDARDIEGWDTIKAIMTERAADFKGVVNDNL